MKVSFAKMPRKKQGPRRLGEDAQRAANFVMGEDGDEEERENNINVNRELTAKLETAPANAVNDIIQSVGGVIPTEEEEGEGSGSGHSKAPDQREDQERVYNVIFDDDEEDSYHSSEDEDFVPEPDTKPKKQRAKKSGTKRKQKNVDNNEETIVIEEDVEVDKELEALLEDAEIVVPVLEKASSDAIWHSPIGKIEVKVDLDRQGTSKLELPQWNQGFQLYLSEIPGRSIVYYEKFDRNRD